MGIASNKTVAMPMENIDTASEEGLLPNEKLNKRARELEILPQLEHKSLLSFCKLKYEGYTTIFIYMSEG